MLKAHFWFIEAELVEVPDVPVAAPDVAVAAPDVAVEVPDDELVLMYSEEILVSYDGRPNV